MIINWTFKGGVSQPFHYLYKGQPVGHVWVLALPGAAIRVVIGRILNLASSVGRILSRKSVIARDLEGA